MSFSDGLMPPSTNLVRLVPDAGSIWVLCEVCAQILGRAFYLSQAIRLWDDHQNEGDDEHPGRHINPPRLPAWTHVISQAISADPDSASRTRGRLPHPG